MMSSTLLEQTRFRHEEIERWERLVVEELQKTKTTSRMDRLVQGHRVRHMIQSIMLNSEKLVETYEDKEGKMEAEIAKLGETDLFYDRLKEIREYHRKLHPSGHSEDYIALVTNEEPVISFSGEEGFEKKQGLTYKEMEEERERDQEAHPHWLKNLRGLQHEFKCEICGNKSYKGRRSFEKHFKEPQHQRGMRLLGIPSTNSFRITTIDEAEELWRRIQRQGMCIWRPELEE